MRPIDARHIADAPAAIDPVFLRTPLLRGTSLDEALGAELLLKVETLNPIRSFKGRGTELLAATLPPGRPLVCASAGNFGQGLARAGARRGMPVTVFAAESANALKLAAMRRLGADVRLAGADFDAAKSHARAYAAEAGALYVEDGALPEIAEGAGTMALEATESAGAPDVALVPLGNGALVTGVGAWLKHAAPATRVVAVVASGAPAMLRSFEAGRAVPTARADTIADGIAVREPVPWAVGQMRGTVDEVVAVDDAHIVAAMRLLHEHAGLVVEPAGAAGLAAFVAFPERWRGASALVPLCGGNVTAAQAREWLLAR
ncbi:MAG: threonine/serine dehydratase [Gemmatimonadaceae bacterium]